MIGAEPEGGPLDFTKEEHRQMLLAIAGCWALFGRSMNQNPLIDHGVKAARDARAMVDELFPKKGK